MERMAKGLAAWCAVGIFTVIVLLYLEGFIFYTFSGNLGFLLSFLMAPLGAALGWIGRKEGKYVKIIGVYGNLAVLAFSLLYWPVGYLAEWILSIVK